MSIARVLRVPRSDTKTNDHVLIHISIQESSDISLLATEGTYPYIITINEANQKQLFAFLGSSSSKHQNEFDGAELVVTLRDGREMVLTLRRMLSGISQKLATATLKRDDTQDIELFDWCELAASSTADREKDLAALQARCDDRQVTIDRLTAQLAELTAAKREQEDEMLEKFRLLLNSKKAKIRDQLRILTEPKGEPGVANHTRKPPSTAPNIAPPSSHPRKRKAAAPTPQNGGNEATKPESEDEVEAERASTPARSESETSEEEAEEEEEGPGLPLRAREEMVVSPPPDAPVELATGMKVANGGEASDEETEDEL